MKLSHSKLSCLLTCPMTYYLNYVQGIHLKQGKAALGIGSAVHWGIEHNTEDLTEYFNEHGGFKTRDSYTRDQLLSEAMVHGYLKHKDEIFEQILSKNDEKLSLIEETHEVFITAQLPSKRFSLTHEFVGIIDLLLLTDKGFVIIDYKTSTYEPDWSKYLEQIYRYIFLLKQQFPDIPIVKIGIINIRKTGIRQKKTETQFEFLQRMKFEYDVNDERYVVYHEYLPEDLNERLISDYIQNLRLMADTAQEIVDNNLYYVNYGNTVSVYGKSDYYDIFYRNPDAYILYWIEDYVWNDETNSFDNGRDCVPIDMLVIDNVPVLNKYSAFKAAANEYSYGNSALFFNEEFNEHFVHHLKSIYTTDDSLLKMYFDTYRKEYEQTEKN